MTAKKAPKRPKAGTSKHSAAERRKAFIEAYLSNGGNATDAALRAGYSKGGASKQGFRMSKDPQIQAEIRQRQDKIAQDLELNTENVLKELVKIARADLRKVFLPDGQLKPMEEWPDDVAGAIASVELVSVGSEKNPAFLRKVKLWDKVAALEKAMKHLGLFEKDNAQTKPEVKVVMIPPKRGKDAG